MKLLHVIHTMRPEAGGVVEAVRLLASAHAELGHPAEVLCLDAPGTTAEGQFPFPVHEIGPAKGGTYGYCPLLVPWLKVNHETYDAVIVHGLWQHVGLATRGALHGSETPYCVFPHGMLDPWFNQAYPLKKLKKQLYWRWGEYRVLRDARQVLFTCEEERRLARKSFKPYDVNEAVVGLGIEEPPGNHEAALTFLRQSYPDIGEDFLLFLGRIDPKKGLDMLIAAYRKLKQEGKRLPAIVIAGPGEDSAHANELRLLLGSETGVHFTGMLKDELKWGALAACAALILPSHQENFGIVVAEALAMGRPVLVTHKVNIFVEVCQGGAGLAQPDTPEGIEILLEQWLALSEPERAAMTTAARPCYLEHFAIGQVAEKLVETIEGESVAT